MHMDQIKKGPKGKKKLLLHDKRSVGLDWSWVRPGRGRRDAIAPAYITYICVRTTEYVSLVE